MGRKANLFTTVLGSAFVIAFLYSAYHGHRLATLAAQEKGDLVVNLGVLPYYAFRSFLRMLGAYLLSGIFTLLYGYRAGTDRKAARWLIPLLDILQSVPILGFFPAAIYVFVLLFQGREMGVELAAIFLIFTSQAWNMTFGFYESLITIPKSLLEAASAYELKGFLRFRRLYFPAGIPKLVYNSIMSWAGGWYFLIAAEIISIGPVKYSLPGLGSYLVRVTEKGELGLTIAGLLVLVTLIALMNAFIWQPLSLWAENYKYEFGSGGHRRRRGGLGQRLWQYVGFLLRLRREKATSTGWGEIPARYGHRLGCLLASRRARPLWVWLQRMAGWALGLGLTYLVARGVQTLILLLTTPWAPEMYTIPRAILFSWLRLGAAYLLSLLWTVPTAIWLGHNERAQEALMPFFEVLASVPATALFPIIVFSLVRFAGGMDLASVFLVLTGMQWYLLFNLVAGVRSIPRDLKEAAAAYGVQGLTYLRKVVLPALTPSLITGSITAWGGGWNALIVSEYVLYAGKVFSTFGIGSLLDQATYVSGNFQVIWSSLIAMIVSIVFMNHFLWRRLFEVATRRYRIEG
ncbi:MAG: ABC transporter permease subunit [Firmicutes bacterium]|nr:ABC transporter permease subunit [Bacillota bacterium]